MGAEVPYADDRSPRLGTGPVLCLLEGGLFSDRDLGAAAIAASALK